MARSGFVPLDLERLGLGRWPLALQLRVALAALGSLALGVLPQLVLSPLGTTLGVQVAVGCPRAYIVILYKLLIKR